MPLHSDKRIRWYFKSISLISLDKESKCFTFNQRAYRLKDLPSIIDELKKFNKHLKGLGVDG